MYISLAAFATLYPYTNTNIFYDLYSKNYKEETVAAKPQVLETLKVNKYDRTYQIWKRESLSLELFTEKAFMQKLEYIHNNAVAAGLVNYVEEYKFCSAKFYLSGIDEFNIITHIVVIDI